MIKDSKNPDIAFLGASVVEEMDGRWFGNSHDEDLNRLEKLFNKNFKKDQGAELDAVALGIAGDTSPSVLWRLLNGEMPSEFNPKIWWLELVRHALQLKNDAIRFLTDCVPFLSIYRIGDERLGQNSL